jgi:hypothetical protein
MQTSQPLKRGGRRFGAGRPRGTGIYGTPTVAIRVPVRLAPLFKLMLQFIASGHDAAGALSKALYHFNVGEDKLGG